jgi:hypothetical protein
MAKYKISLRKSAIKELGGVPKKDLQKVTKLREKYKLLPQILDLRGHKNYLKRNNIVFVRETIE